MTLSCTVPVGTPISSILWSRPSNEQISTVTRVTNGLLLLLSSVSAETTDQYTCSVTDTSGTTITQSIGVQVLSKTMFIFKPKLDKGLTIDHGFRRNVQEGPMNTSRPFNEKFQNGPFLRKSPWFFIVLKRYFRRAKS